MDPEGDLDQHLRHLIRLFADGAAPVGRLAPGGPVEAGVDPDAGRALLPGQAVGGLEAHVAQEDVHLEALLDGLALQEGPFEGAPVRADELGEDVVQHAGAEATVLPVSADPEPRRLPRGWTGGSSPTPTRAAPGRPLHRPSSPSRGALDAGATAIELDVHATRDGHLVVCHDATVDRTTNSAGVIAQMTWGELRTLDNAYWWAPGADVSPGLDPDCYPYRGRAPEDRRFCIALLEEVLDAFPGVVLNLDIKQTAPVVPPYEQALAAMLRRFGRTDDVIVASFLDTATDAFSTFAPEIPTSAGTVAVAAFYQAVQSGKTPNPCAMWPSRSLPGTATSPWSTTGSWRWPTKRVWPSTSGPSRTRG